MFFAILGDIKSNFSGLKAVLHDLEQNGIQLILHTGNTCEGPEGARECIHLLRQRGVICVQGKQDRKLVRRKTSRGRTIDADDLVRQTHAALDSAAIEYLHQLPRKRVVQEEGVAITLCHGSLNCPSEILSGETPVDRFRRQRELDVADIVVSGGAPEPFAVLADGVLFVGPGAMTIDADWVRYTLVNTETVPFSASVRTVSMVQDANR